MYQRVDLRPLAAQLGMRLAFWLCNPASAYSAFAFQKDFAKTAERGEGLLIRILSSYQKLLLGSELGP